MTENQLRREIVPFPFAWVAFALCICISVLFASLFFYQLMAGPIGSRPTSNWAYLLMFLMGDFFALIALNFARLTITMAARGISVAFGLISKTMNWEDVEGCRLDTSSFLAYGGWGIRMSWRDGIWRLGYTVIGSPRVVLTLRAGRFRELAFSSKDPDGTCRLIGEAIGRGQGNPIG